MQGIKTLKSGLGQASPGKATAFHLTADTLDKPSIIVDGDGAESVTLLTPKSDQPNDWSYDVKQIFKSDSHSVIGQSAVVKATVDHPTLIFTPEYGNDLVHVFEVEK